jgi:hypothetical protein
MADIYCPTVIHPVIALADMTPLEALLLSQVFDAEPEADGLYFFAEQGPNDAIRLPVKQLRALLSASAGVPSTAADQVVRCLAAVPDGETEIVLDLSGSQGDQDTDINRSTWRDILQDIVRRSPRLRSVTAVSSFTGSKLRHDYVGGKVVFVTADQIQTRSTADIEEEFHAQVPEIKDHAAPSGDTATGDPSCTTGMLFATTLVDWRVAEGDDDRLPSALRAPYCVTISRGGQGGLILDVTAPNGALTEFDLEADMERFFGPTITISTGRVVPVRLIGEQHVREDLGFIPSFADWVRCIRPEPWMGRAQPIHRDVDPFAAAG